MKVLYCNPIFLDYRIPFYKRMNELFCGNFYIMFSKWRYEGRRDDLLARLENEMGENAIAFTGDKVWDSKSRSFNKFPKGKRIPLVHGLIRKLIEEKPDVLITEGFFQWTPLVVLYAALFRKPVFIGYERTLHTERNTSKFVTWTRTITDKFVSGYLVNGSETKKYLMSIGVKENKIAIGGMSADGQGLKESITKMTKEEISAFKSHYSSADGLIYLFSGRVEILKGAPHLLSAWEKHIIKHPSDKIILIGMGDKYDELKRKYKDEKSIYLEGRVNYQDVHKYYAIADVFILPTLTDNWSLVIPEAMSCGLPVSTSIYNGCYPELVHKDENGFVFDTLNEQTIIEALDYFHDKDLKKFGRASVRLEEVFNTENSAKREYEGIIRILKQQ